MFKTLNRKARKGFSLVELVVVILIIAILAVAVFAGGSAIIKKAQVSQATSDLHNFSIAIESAMNETPSVANMSSEADFTDIVKAVNKNLAADYQLTRLATDVSGNTVTKQGVASTGAYAIYESAKKDAWGNSYYVVFDCADRHNDGISEFYITVVTAGPNAQTTITNETTGNGIEADDLFLLVQYTDGDVNAVIYNVANDTLMNGADTQEQLFATVKGVKNATKQGQYIGGVVDGDGRTSVCPVNFQPVANSYT